MTRKAREPGMYPLAQSTPLRRSLGPVALCLFGLGNILGAGIYVLVGEVAGSAGMLAPLSFLLAGVVAALSACTYAELAARYPVSAGEAVWIHEGFGIRAMSVVVGLMIAAAGLTSSATLARGFAGYFGALWPVSVPVASVSLVLCLGALAAWGVSASVRAAALLTVVEAMGLVLVVVVAGRGLTVEALLDLPASMTLEVDATMGVVAGGFLAFFAFIGFEDMVNVAEEVRDPRRSFARAIFWALSIAAILYMTVSIVCVLTIPPRELATEPAPLAAVYTRAGGPWPGIMAVIGMVAVVNGVLVQIIMAARVAYGMSRRGWLPAVLGRVHPQTRTPLLATAMVTGIVALLAASVDLGSLARLTSFIVLTVFVLVNVALVRILRHGPPVAGIRVLPGWLPVAGAVSAVGLLVVALVRA